MKKLSGKRVLLFLMITPVLLMLQLFVGFFVFNNLQNINRYQEQQNKLDTYLRANSKYISNAESAESGYLLTGDKKYLEAFKGDYEEIGKNEDYYSTLPPPVVTDEILSIRNISRSKIDEMTLTMNLSNNEMEDSALNIIKKGNGKLLMDSIRKTTLALRTRISDQITATKNTEKSLFILFLSIIFILILFNLFLVWYSYRKLKGYTENLEHLVTSLEDANERLREYTFMSYHDLKTPLRGISGFAQLLTKRFEHHLSSEEKEYVEYITENVKKMDLTINEMRKKYLTEPANDKHYTT